MKKTVVITGSSRGIGAAAALEFAQLGYNVVINYNKSKEKALNLLEKVRSLGCVAIAVKADISKFSEADYLISKSLEEFGKIDILINNAGIAEQKLFTELSEEDWRRMFDVNIHGMFNCTLPVANHMIGNHRGKIINVSSVWGVTGASCEVHYSASKAAVIGFTKALAKELGPSGIQVNCVAPGVIDTEMNSGLNETEIRELIEKTPCERLGTVHDVAKAILFLSSPDSDFISGQVISTNGGFFT